MNPLHEFAAYPTVWIYKKDLPVHLHLYESTNENILIPRRFWLSGNCCINGNFKN